MKSIPLSCDPPVSIPLESPTNKPVHVYYTAWPLSWTLHYTVQRDIHLLPQLWDTTIVMQGARPVLVTWLANQRSDATQEKNQKHAAIRLAHNCCHSTRIDKVQTPILNWSAEKEQQRERERGEYEAYHRNGGDFLVPWRLAHLKTTHDDTDSFIRISFEPPHKSNLLRYHVYPTHITAAQIYC